MHLICPECNWGGDIIIKEWQGSDSKMRYKIRCTHCEFEGDIFIPIEVIPEKHGSYYKKV